MTKSIKDIKKRRGRPAIGRGAPVLVRLRPDMEANLDAYIAKQPDEPSRPEAIRRLLDDALPKPKVKTSVSSEISKLLEPHRIQQTAKRQK
jgi:hypothetical protein